MYGFFIDPLYIILVGPAILLTMFAEIKVKSTFNRWKQRPNSRGMTGAQAAQYMMDIHGIHDVSIHQISGELTDHFDPTNKTVNLSSEVFGGTSIASIGVACHEVGHVIQHEEGYVPIKIRMAIIPITNIGSELAIPLIVLGLILNVTGLAKIGVWCFALSTLFQLVTLPVEFNASHRALDTIKNSGMFVSEDYEGAKSVLTAAALTYVGALFVSLMQLLRWIIIVNGSDRDQ